MPKISVIVTNYNYGRYLYECVTSIRKQSFQDFELIIVDDASTDGSDALVPRMADKSILFSKNQGTAVASNAGVHLASGEFCVFVNADDRIGPDFLKSTLAGFDSDIDKKLAFVYTDFWHFGKGRDGQEINNGIIFPAWDLDNLKKFNYILCSALFRKSVFESVGGFTVDFGMEDYDLWLRMGLAGYCGKKVDGYLYEYRAHDANRTYGVDVHGAMEKIKALRLTAETTGPTTQFSLCYATRRSWFIAPVVEEWLKSASNPELVEVVICVDSEDILSVQKAHETVDKKPNVSLVVQENPPFNCVKAWNLAATKAKGRVLVMVSDDFVPPKNWDRDLLGLKPNWTQGEFVVRVNDCNNSTQDKPFTLPILTRTRYERFGHVFCPEYESMFSDTEFGERAEMDGVVINAKTLLFEHVHHSCFKRNEDDIDRQHSSKERWDQGEAIFKRRKALGFESAKLPDGLDLIKAYSKYVTEVKSPIFSVSMEGSLWLEDYLKMSKYRSAIDIGANFSSVVLAHCGLAVAITDVQEHEANRTLAFIQSMGLSATKTHIDQLLAKSNQYDVVFVNAYDANSPQRFELITKVAPNLVRDGGVILLNDGHFVNVRKAMDELTTRGWTSTVPNQTMDRYERFWMVLRR